MVIDDYQWFAIHKAEQEVSKQFIQLLNEGNNIGIISEAGCPGVADPGANTGAGRPAGWHYR